MESNEMEQVIVFWGKKIKTIKTFKKWRKLFTNGDIAILSNDPAIVFKDVQSRLLVDIKDFQLASVDNSFPVTVYRLNRVSDNYLKSKKCKKKKK